MKIENIKEAEAALRPYIPLVSQLTGKDTTLDRIKPLMKLLGNPYEKLKVVHLAGTSGKTSTAYYMSALLLAAGKKVGLTVSPHIDSITERIQINGQIFPEAEFCRELGIFLDIVEKSNIKPSYFELLFAFAIWVFDRQGVDYAVVETGLGGLHDATNVINNRDKICIITDIGFDHKAVLGKSLKQITAQKIGIVHDHNLVFMYQQTPEIMEIVEKWTTDHEAKLYVTTEKNVTKAAQEDLSIIGFQRRNWLLAYFAFRHLAKEDLQHLTSQVLTQTQMVHVPGRFDILSIQGKTIVMDGAHNAQKMSAFLNSFRQKYPGVNPAILIALKDDKEYQGVVSLLAPFASRIIVTTFRTWQDLLVVSMDPEKLANELRAKGANKVTVLNDSHKAYQALLNSPEKVGVITGSFYLLGQIRNNEKLT